MRAEAIRDALHAKPFRPIRLYVSDGSSYDIKHQELCVVGVHDAFIGFPVVETPEPAFERYVIVALTHITRLEPIAAQAEAS